MKQVLNLWCMEFNFKMLVLFKKNPDMENTFSSEVAKKTKQKIWMRKVLTAQTQNKSNIVKKKVCEAVIFRWFLDDFSFILLSRKKYLRKMRK